MHGIAVVKFGSVVTKFVVNCLVVFPENRVCVISRCVWNIPDESNCKNHILMPISHEYILSHDGKHSTKPNTFLAFCVRNSVVDNFLLRLEYIPQISIHNKHVYG